MDETKGEKGKRKNEREGENEWGKRKGTGKRKEHFEVRQLIGQTGIQYFEGSAVFGRMEFNISKGSTVLGRMEFNISKVFTGF
ncbi:unnamed protein product [Rhizophagus irregularis]|nr:unnamed protein product [Rhizophagus irregularis]